MNGQLYQECELTGCHTEPVCVDCLYCEKHCTCPTADEKAALLIQNQQRKAELAAKAAEAAARTAAKNAWVEEKTSGLQRSFVLDGLVSGSVAWNGSWARDIQGIETEYPDWLIRELDGVLFYSHYYGNAHVIYASQNVIDKLISEYARSFEENIGRAKFVERMTLYATTYPNCIGGDVATRAIELGLV
ncbi:MAG: hypothetical protein IAE79_17665 [Anaerolinea sp.]|nr:hypothetical protein [Anaerolinea sp.]